MEIVDKVKVAGFIYDVTQKDSSFIGTSGIALDGEHLFTERKIILGGQGSKEYRELVFLHEICHAIIEAYISPEGQQDEHFVEAFSKGLYQVIVDNPKIFAQSIKVGEQNA